ncbi:hypothetical protein c7_R1268 [Megavirus courdo7]|uniref:F-box and FNIP repeat-containing protein n=1 Tax=Megavirus courdo7 TaxID=1128135 RepID=H2ECK7_9VIRU|nr:hypothetical protein c7_R1268 [Megavirus courdo7]
MSNIDILNDDVILSVFNYLSNKDKIMFCSVNKYYKLLSCIFKINMHDNEPYFDLMDLVIKIDKNIYWNICYYFEYY